MVQHLNVLMVNYPNQFFLQAYLHIAMNPIAPEVECEFVFLFAIPSYKRNQVGRNIATG